MRGRVAVVTGAGRRRGIGAAICRALVEKGTNLYFLLYSERDRRASPLEAPKGSVEAPLRVDDLTRDPPGLVGREPRHQTCCVLG